MIGGGSRALEERVKASAALAAQIAGSC